MKKYIVLLSLFIGIGSMVSAQTKDEKDVASAVETWRKGYENSDKAILESITSEALFYAHSNGKMQDKPAFVEEVVNGPLKYSEVAITDQTIHITENLAIVHHLLTGKTTAKSDGAKADIKLGITMVFRKEHGKWKLLVRQAYKA